MYFNDTRYDWQAYGPDQKWSPHSYGLASEPGGVNDGEALWQKLVSKHPGFIFTLNGHVLGDGTGQLTSLGAGGNVVHQLLANYQSGVKPEQPEGGGGFLRLMTFEPDGKTVTVKTYSPHLDEWLEDPSQDFIVSLDATDYDYLLGADSYPSIQIEDDPNNATLVNCDPGPITSPGADIDAAILMDSKGEQLALLTGCDLQETAGCDNDNNMASDAHGTPDAPGSEKGGGYVSLNGGTLTCGWTGGQTVEKGAEQLIEVHEIGGSVEDYRFKLCVDPSSPLSCTTVNSYGSGVQLVPIDELFFD